MKFILVLFLITIGLCFGLDSGHHLKYKYSASFKVGIPDDGDQVAGLAFKANVDVFVEDNDGTAVLKLSEVSTLNFNEELGIGEEIDFTDERFKPFEDEDLKRIVEQPFRANLRDSEPFAIEYEETDHRWLSNVRKGIALMLKNEILKGNFETQEKDSVSSLFHQGHLVNNFVVEEETLFGICKAKYNINQIPETMFSGSNDLTPTRYEGARNDLWHVSRSIDFDNCKEIVALHSHTTNNIRHKEKKLDITRTSVSSYVLRGSPGNFHVYSAVTEGAMTYPLSIFKEQAQSTVKQKLVLINDHTSEATPELGPSLMRSATWMHEIWSPFQAPKDSKTHPWIVYKDKNEPDLGFDLHGAKKYNADEIAAVKVKVEESIKDASQRLTDLDQEAGDPPSDAISESLEMASSSLKPLKKENILEIFDLIFDRNVGIERQLVINAAAATGSYETMEAIMDYMEEGKIEPFQIFTTFLTLQWNSFGALNVSRMMDFLLQQEKPSDYLLIFAHYLSEYCVHKTHTYVPNAGDAECDSILTTKRFIPYLKDIIYNEDLTWERGYAVKVLDLLRNGFTFEIVSPLIDGRMKSSAALKAMAIRALENWNIYPDNIMRSPIMDLLTDVYSDVSQDLHVRIAALLAIISWQPTTKFWYNLALRTWKDPSNEFASFASSLIEIYAEQNLPIFEKQSKGAANAVKFSKPPSRSSYSFNIARTETFLNRQITLLASDVNKANERGFEDSTFTILTNFQQFLQIKAENLYQKTVYFNETVQKEPSNIPDAQEFLNKLYKEIEYVEHPILTKKIPEYFLNIFNDVFIKLSSIENMPSLLSRDQTDSYKFYWGVYLDLMDKRDFYPNELGLPSSTYSSLPLAISYSTKFHPPKSGVLFESQALLSLSLVHSSEISITLPWKRQQSSVFVRSNLELILPIGMKKKRTVGTEGPLESSKTYFDIAYKKKFPLLRLSNTPMTLTFDVDPKAETEMTNEIIIKKLNIIEKRINEVNPATGIKYDLVMRTDNPNSFGLGDFLQIPKESSRYWHLDLYLEPENSETTELLVTYLNGNLLNPDEYKEPGSDHYPEETRKEKSEVSFYDNFEERSRKIRKLLNNSNELGDVRYVALKFDLLGKVPRNFEAFNVFYNKVEEPSDHEYTFETIGFTSASIEQQYIPKSVCFIHHAYEHTDPERHYFDFDSAVHKIPYKEQTLQVLRGCTESVFNANVAYNISEERSIEIKEYCKRNYGEEKCYVENDEFWEFDSIQATVHTEENDTMAKYVILFFKNLLEIPSAKVFGYDIPRHNQQFNFRRNFQNGNWDLFLKHESEDVFLSTFPHNDFFKYFTDYPTDVKKQVEAFLSTHPKCTLTTNSVETFDGVKLNYKLSTCWTLVSQAEERYHRFNVFLVRKPQGESSIPDFKYIMHNSGRVIDFSNNEIKVNGSIVHRIKEDDESNSYENLHDSLIYKKGNSFLIYPGSPYKKPSIIVRNNKIEYFPERGYLSLNGICGNGDGETIPELIGPKKCVYNDGQIFTASWTGSSENCDSATLKEYRKGVEDYQTKCEPFYGQLKESPMNHRCLLFGWETLATNETSYCISEQPLTFCSSDCDIKKTKTVKIAFKCWPKEKAPERLKTSIESKVNIVTDKIDADPYFFEYSYTEIAKICKQLIL